MNAGAIASPGNIVLRLWRDPAAWVTAADIFAVLTALALPWSTSLVAIFVLCWLGTAAWTLDYRVYFQSLKRPICFLPIALFVLAAVGTLWSDASWAARLYAVGPAAKLLVLPGLFYHFERSTRGMWVFIAFLLSCTLLMAVSWIVAFDPGLTLKPQADASRGIFVKNYIDQSQEFVLVRGGAGLSDRLGCCGRNASGWRHCSPRSRWASSSTWRSLSCRGRRWSPCRSCWRFSRLCI